MIRLLEVIDVLSMDRMKYCVNALTVIFCVNVITYGASSEANPNSSGCLKGHTDAFQSGSHPDVAGCMGEWTGHVATSPLCAPGWQVCSWRDQPVLSNITWDEAINVTGCYAINAAQDGGSCKPCTDNIEQDDMAGIGSQCAHQILGQGSCISGGRISASCCIDSHFNNACMFKPGLVTGVMCCRKKGVAPTILIHPQSLTHVTVGVTFVLSCQATGDPTPTVKWLRNGLPFLKNTTRISEFSSGYLLISAATTEDSGTYECVVTNEVGQASSAAKVIITDYKSGCADGTTDGLEKYENVQACKGTWRGHVRRGKRLCRKGWHVCNPRHEEYLKMLTWTDVHDNLPGCYGYNAVNKNTGCQRCHSGEEMAGIGRDCGKIKRGAGTCLAHGHIEVYTHKKDRGCNYSPGQVSGVMCCKRPTPEALAERRKKGAQCRPQCDNGGVCVGHNQCECRKGYKGAWCQHPVCAGGCVANSYCIKPNVCRCYSGYTFNGEKCTQKQRKKQRKSCKHPCFNGGHCKHGHCKCAYPYFGKMCQHGGSKNVLIIQNHKAKKYQFHYDT